MRRAALLCVAVCAACFDSGYVPEPPDPPDPAAPQGGSSGDTDAAAPGGDAAAADDPLDDPFDDPPTCTSAMTYSGGTGPLMRPGDACIACHAANGAPALLVAGTVYPTGHEPTGCYGVPAGSATVELTDANGLVVALEVNQAGNFFLLAPPALVFPLRARVLAEGRERVMGSPLAAADCNGCHTQDGANGAPGRIVSP